MSKVKMRCITCGKWFQSANAKEVTCPECSQKARKEKMAAKTAPATPNKAAGQGTPARVVPPPPKPKPASTGTSHWLDSISDIKVSEPDQPPVRPKIPPSPVPRDNRGGPGGPMGPGTYRDRDERRPGSPGGYREEANRDRGPGSYREGDQRGPGSYRDRAPGISGTIGQRPRQPMEGGPGYGPRPAGIGEQRSERPYTGGQKGGKPASAGGRPAKDRTAKPATPPKPKREKIPPPLPFTPTEEQIKQVEERYLELSTPAEYDGIRTQIAKELSIPKKAVKKIVKELRDRQGIPSWWELQTYKGDAEELEKIRALYEPYLPLPPVGVHKTLAEELSIKPGDVYQAIKLIRQEMHLPQYNDPALHGIELRSMKKKDAASQDSTTQEEQSRESKEEQAELVAPATDAEKPLDQVTEAPVPTSDTETAPDTVAELPASVNDTATASDVVTEAPASTTNVSPVQATEGTGLPETPEAVAATATDVKTEVEE